MRAIKIDVIKKEIYEVNIKGNLLSIYEQLDCNEIDAVRLSSTEIMYVDGIGLHRKPFIGAFRINGYSLALPGHGLILGLNGPQEISSKLEIKEVSKNIKFVDVNELPSPVMTVYSFEQTKDFMNFMNAPTILWSDFFEKKLKIDFKTKKELDAIQNLALIKRLHPKEQYDNKIGRKLIFNCLRFCPWALKLPLFHLNGVEKDFISGKYPRSYKDLKINGNDLILMGFKEGKEIGNILDELIEKILDDKLQNDEEQLKKYVTQFFKI